MVILSRFLIFSANWITKVALYFTLDIAFNIINILSKLYWFNCPRKLTFMEHLILLLIGQLCHTYEYDKL